MFVCPPLATYSPADQLLIAETHDALPLDHPARRALNDYHALRNACRAIK